MKGTLVCDNSLSVGVHASTMIYMEITFAWEPQCVLHYIEGPITHKNQLWIPWAWPLDEFQGCSQFHGHGPWTQSCKLALLVNWMINSINTTFLSLTLSNQSTKFGHRLSFQRSKGWYFSSVDFHMVLHYSVFFFGRGRSAPMPICGSEHHVKKNMRFVMGDPDQWLEKTDG